MELTEWLVSISLRWHMHVPTAFSDRKADAISRTRNIHMDGVRNDCWIKLAKGDSERTTFGFWEYEFQTDP